jgi:hypothetical protein
MFTPVFTMAGDARSVETAGDVVKADSEGLEAEILVLEDGTEEALSSYPKKDIVPASVDDRLAAIESEAQEKIQTVLLEIDQPEGGTDDGELQKQIETIKRDAEIARLRIRLEDAEEAQDFDLSYQIRDEIEHLENLGEPVIGFPDKQPAP